MSRAHVRTALLLASSMTALAGSLEPPGPPSPTMKTLVELEPRIAVQALPVRETGERVIAQPGSYYLAGNLWGGGGVTAISIEAPDVILDLNGFALIGTEESDTGINILPPSKNVVVRNGTITGWPVNAVFGANCEGCELSDLLVDNCGSRVSASAVSLGRYGVVRRVTVRDNAGGPGIDVVFNGRIESSIAANNGIGFMLSGDTGSIIDSIAVNNDQGIHLQAASSAIGCVASYNRVGFVVIDGSRVASSNAVGNANGVEISGFGAQVENNLLALNAYDSILIGDAAGQVRIAGNVIRCADGGTGVTTSGALGNLVVGNSFRGCATPIAASGNAVGELLDLTGGGTIGSANPYANIVF